MNFYLAGSFLEANQSGGRGAAACPYFSASE